MVSAPANNPMSGTHSGVRCCARTADKYVALIIDRNRVEEIIRIGRIICFLRVNKIISRDPVSPAVAAITHNRMPIRRPNDINSASSVGSNAVRFGAANCECKIVHGPPVLRNAYESPHYQGIAQDWRTVDDFAFAVGDAEAHGV